MAAWRRHIRQQVALALWASSMLMVSAKGGEETLQQTIVGAVECRQTEDNKLEAFLVSGDGEIYSIVMDDKGRRFAEECQGKLVKVAGAVRMEGEGDETVRWLTVHDWQEIPEEEVSWQPILLVVLEKRLFELLTW